MSEIFQTLPLWWLALVGVGLVFFVGFACYSCGYGKGRADEYEAQQKGWRER